MLEKRIINSLYCRYFRVVYQKKFKSFGKRTNVLFPLNINGIENISIGDNVNIAYKTWLAAVSLTGSDKCELVIGKGTSIGNFNHIYATSSIVIGANVLIADKVYITDNLHNYEDIRLPIMVQPIKQIGEVVIGDGSWIGESVSVIGAKIGMNCVIGANSVVTKDVADYCIAVGVPAKVIKRYCLLTDKWRKTNETGEFINNEL
jgi:acetyltransferase-like isoleucine patch superfamily enzyme